MAFGSFSLSALFPSSASSFLLSTWMEHRPKEREAFYRAETIRRIAEAPGEGGQFLREQALRVSGRAKA